MPKWGNFVGAADEDLLAFALIMQAGGTLLNIAMYHLTQATEKYLKALVLSIIDPKGETETFHTQRRLLRTHDLVKLADFCGQKFPYYKRQDVRDNLKRFTFFDQAGRYPWTQDPILYVRFSTSDIPIFEELVGADRKVGPVCFSLRGASILFTSSDFCFAETTSLPDGGTDAIEGEEIPLPWWRGVGGGEKESPPNCHRDHPKGVQATKGRMAISYVAQS